jgi:hypothetical protein
MITHRTERCHAASHAGLRQEIPLPFEPVIWELITDGCHQQDLRRFRESNANSAFTDVQRSAADRSLQFALPSLATRRT